MSVSTPSKRRPSGFDRYGFIKSAKNIGRAYRKQALELIEMCRTFLLASKQGDRQDTELKRVLQAVGAALNSVAEAGKKSSKDAENALQKAIEILAKYERDFHPTGINGNESIEKRMEAAQKKDKTSSAFLLFHRKRTEDADDWDSKEVVHVRFKVLSSPVDKEPQIVDQILSPKPKASEILWNLSRLKSGKHKRIALKDNPHFYSDLPHSTVEYQDTFRQRPIHDFRFDDTTSPSGPEICVLLDKTARVFLETKNKTRTFGNVWRPGRAMIFKDICGELEGEKIVEQDIEGTPDLFHRVEESETTTPEPSSPEREPRARKPAPPRPRIDTSVPATNPQISLSGRMFTDWKDLLRHTLTSPDISVRISTRGSPSADATENWVPSSPINPAPSPVSSSTPRPRTRRQVAGASLASLSPLRLRLAPSVQSPLSPMDSPTYVSALSTPVSPQASRSPNGPGELAPTASRYGQMPEPSVTPNLQALHRPSPSTAPPSHIVAPPQNVRPTDATSAQQAQTSASPRFPSHPHPGPSAPAAAAPQSSNYQHVQAGRSAQTDEHQRAGPHSDVPPRPAQPQSTGFHDSAYVESPVLNSFSSVTNPRVASPSPSPPVAPSAPPKLPDPKPATKKKNWFQRVIWDYSKSDGQGQQDSAV